MATKFEWVFDPEVSTAASAAISYVVVVDGTRIGELDHGGNCWWFDDYSEGDQTYFDEGISFQEAKAETIKYLDQIGYEPGEEVPDEPITN